MARKEIKVVKEGALTNVADLGTKHLDEANVVKFLTRLGYQFRDGRSREAPEVSGKAWAQGAREFVS